MRSRWNPPPWFAKPAPRIQFIRELSGVKDVRLLKDKSAPGGFSVGFNLQPTGVPQRSVTISFSRRSPASPRVHVNGPADSPHRYGDGSLCMWFPGDPRELRWVPADGAAELVVRIGVHLMKEEWYRHTGEWIGGEVKHGPRDEANDPKVSQ